jgi:hypothetical protein
VTFVVPHPGEATKGLKPDEHLTHKLSCLHDRALLRATVHHAGRVCFGGSDVCLDAAS